MVDYNPNTVYATSPLTGNALSLDEDGCLVETYCAGGALYHPGHYVMWDELSEEKFNDCEFYHKKLLESIMPEKLEDIYPTYE